jgi:PKD repeat protein
VAYKSTPAHNNFMVVYECDAVLDPPNEYGSDLCLRLISAAGVPDARAPRPNHLGDDRRPAVVYNPAANQYLIVTMGTGAGGKVWATRRDALGDPVAPSGSEVAASSSVASAPALAYNPAENEYLVLWTESVTGGYALRGRVMGADESLISPVFAANTGNSLADDSVGAGIYLSETNRYRVAWDDQRSPETSWDIWGQWVEADGAAIAAPDLPIFRYAGWQRNPDIALGLTDGEAFTLWQDGRNGASSDIYGRLGALDHTPPIPAFTTDPTIGRAGEPFIFDASASRDDLTPPGALVVRWDFQNDGVWDTEFAQEKTVTRTYAVPGVYTVALQVRDWAALTGTVTHAVAVLPQTVAMAQAAAPAPTARLTVSPTYAQAGAAFTADAAGSTGAGSLQVRWDWENDGVWDTAFSTTLTASHSYTVADDHVIRADVKDTTGLTDAALQIVTVLPGEPASLQIAPTSVRLAPGQSVQFRAGAWDTYGNRLWNPEINWSLSSAEVGTLDSTGWFTASAQAGFYPDAVVVTIPGLTARASVTIFWPQQLYLPEVLRGP